MKKSVLSLASIAVLSFSTVIAQAQPTVTSTAMGGSIPRPQAMGGSIPRPTALGTLVSSVALYFGYIM